MDKSEVHKVFRYNEDASVQTLDPAFVKSQAENWICAQLFNGLVSLDSRLKPAPSLASAWEISEDGKVYTFQLRQDVCFHPFEGGRKKFTAQDAEWSFYRILDPATASPGAWIFNDKVLYPCGFDSLRLLPAGQRPFYAANDSTLVIRLRSPFPAFLSLLAMPYCYVVHPEAVKKAGRDFRSKPVGTGPFLFKRWDEDVKLILRRNDAYWERDSAGRSLPYLEAVNVDFVRQKQTAFLRFLQGEYDFFNGFDGSFKDQLLTPQGQLQPALRDRLNIEVSDFLNTEYLGIMVDPAVPAFKNHPLQNEKIRRALNYAVDRNVLLRTLRNGIGRPGTAGFVPPVLIGGKQLNLYDYQPRLAEKLLEEAGYPKGKGLSGIQLDVTGDYLDMAVLLKDQWKQIGIQTEIRSHPGGFLRQLRNKLETNFFRGSWIADYPDAENYLACFTTQNFSPGGPNYTHHSSMQFDRLFAVSQEQEGMQRTAQIRAADSLMMQSSPVIVLYYDQSVRLSRKWVHGLHGHPMNWLDLRRVYKDKHP